MQFVCEDFGHFIVMRYSERRLDGHSASLFREMARDVVRPNCQIYILDLSSVTFVDSSGVGAIVGFLKFLGRERRLELCGMNPMVRKVFRLTRLDQVFTIRDTVDCCTESISVNKVAAD